jgi:quinol monooxygenase YgiN
VPVAVHITPKQMSKSDYDRVIKELEASGSGDPDGRVFHAAYGDDDVHMFEVWRSPEDFEAHRDRLFAVLQGCGFDAGSVDVHTLQSDLPD